MKGLEVWRDLFLAEIKQRFAGSRGDERESLELAFRGLDVVLPNEMKGKEWLGQQLGMH